MARLPPADAPSTTTFDTGVRLEEASVDGEAVVERRGEWMVRRHAVVDTPRAESGADRRQRAHHAACLPAAGDESTPVDIEQDRRVVVGVDARRCDRVDPDPRDGEYLDTGTDGVRARREQRGDRAVHHREAFLPACDIVVGRIRRGCRQPFGHRSASPAITCCACSLTDRGTGIARVRCSVPRSSASSSMVAPRPAGPAPASCLTVCPGY